MAYYKDQKDLGNLLNRLLGKKKPIWLEMWINVNGIDIAIGENDDTGMWVDDKAHIMKMSYPVELDRVIEDDKRAYTAVIGKIKGAWDEVE